MNYRLFLTREATRDADEGYDWYENRQQGLGRKFLDTLDSCFFQILRSPGQFRKFRSHHVAVVKKFPYKIAFTVDGEVVIVFAIYHDKRDPDNLRERLTNQ